jgi:hypothetical protein
MCTYIAPGSCGAVIESTGRWHQTRLQAKAAKMFAPDELIIGCKTGKKAPKVIVLPDKPTVVKLQLTLPELWAKRQAF